MALSSLDRVAIVPRLGKPNIRSICSELLEWLSGHQIESVMPMSEAEALGRQEIGCSDDELVKDAHLIVVLGGDGTILKAARLLNGKQTPILGVNLGKLGFLAEVELGHLFAALEKTISGDFELEKRMLLDCEIRANGALIKKSSLNEIFVGRGASHKLVEFDIKINGKFFDRFSCDGLIFSTPTGSTAYALSAGGPLVSPANKLILFVPVCPHSLFNRSLILSEEDEIEISLAQGASKCTVTIDGLVAWSNRCFDHIKVVGSSKAVNIVRFGKRDFYTILREKLKIYSPFSDEESEA